ncbi:nuclear speckle splicing regulatory protein 1-like protein [Carex littledalei]|uniref:Nuclear speckle splicing regulatory protein 1-like protein n=1 Tax=Carex littledalei TaxID=544730 RepID=A0A833VYR9_9POAL|nr:nuclear speckle splicing regulatory protein 1-like protein [Carex littledalei]
MKKYGLQLRKPPGQSSKPAAAAPVRRPPPSIFGNDDDDDVEKEISRQASKTASLQKIEEQHKKALEEDPSVFDYDGVYDDMKEKIAKPKIQEQTERKSKYIERLMEKAKERERVHEIIYEKKLIKERSKEDHLYGDKEKFLTSAYRKKLAEQAKWMEEERLQQLREEKEDVTKKKDLSEFYFSLNKNIALGAGTEDSSKPAKTKTTQDDSQITVTRPITENPPAKESVAQLDEKPSSKTEVNTEEEIVPLVESKAPLVEVEASAKDEPEAVKGEDVKLNSERFKRSGDNIASLREKYLARKRAKEQI